MFNEMKDKKDYFGRELNIGDKVVYMDRNYREFKEGIIEKFTKVYVFLSFDTCPYSIKQTGDQLIKVI